MKIRHCIPLIALAFAACNKDEVIIDNGAGPGPDTPDAKGSPWQTSVFEYTPAPGQFINETKTGGFSGNEFTPAEAAAYALDRLKNRRFVSLGAFGGYIVVGFDHSIRNTDAEWDFIIEGNAFDNNRDSSNEPGVVWVMQDTNGNGLSDDTWYQLAGSETGLATTLENYSVTYTRPEDGHDVEWIGSDGETGAVKYLKSQHNQPSYYPAWIEADTYTLTGTRLPARNYRNEAGNWANPPFAWGYADNIGSDAYVSAITEQLFGQFTGFEIDNAIDADGKPVTLKAIDFIKVQSAVMAQSGWIGENSCEVLSFIDFALIDNI